MSDDEDGPRCVYRADGVVTSDDAYELALIAWCRYHVATEAFDRSISSARHPRTGNAVLIDWWDCHRSAAFAHEQGRALSVAAGLHGATTQHDDQRAKEQVCSWSYETQRRFLDEHGVDVDAIDRCVAEWRVPRW